MEIGVAADRRLRASMEDRAVISFGEGLLIAGVFDGHSGTEVVDFAVARAVWSVTRAVVRLEGEAMWRQVFSELDAEVQGCGSTATLAVVYRGQVSVGWVGDSEAVLVKRSSWRSLTSAHRVEREDERTRILECGGWVKTPYVGNPGVSRALTVTRVLGDREYRDIGITAVPEVVVAELDAETLAIIMGTDGLWNIISAEEVVGLYRESGTIAAARQLVDTVRDRGGQDNVTVVVADVGNGLPR